MSGEQEYNKGDLVQVTIAGRVVGEGDRRFLTNEDGLLIKLNLPSVTVERLAPPEPEVPEWWERRGPGMSVLDNRRPWLHLADDLQFPWVAPPNLARTDVQMLELADGPLTLLYDPSDTEKAPAEPLHKWPPKEPGLWYRDVRFGWRWVSFAFGDEIRVCVTDAPQNECVCGSQKVADVAAAVGPMIPYPAPGGASC